MVAETGGDTGERQMCACIFVFLYLCIYDEKLLGIQRVSNLSIGNQRISTRAHSIVVQLGKYVSSEFMV